MRWLLLKDLQILRRSPLVTALLIGYPVVIGILIGFALSGDEGKPRVAFLNEVAEGESFDLGAGEDEFGSTEARGQLCDRVECVDVDSRSEAEQMVRDGEVLGALILPEDLLDRLRSLTTLNPEEPTVEVLVNEDDPVKAQLVDDRISALITEANLVLSQRISEQAAAYIDLLIEGGTFTVPFLGDSIEILGLTASSEILTSVAEELPPDKQAELEQVIEFSETAEDNLEFALPLLGAVASPIAVDKQVVSGASTSLSSFAIGIAATVTLMFVTVLLVAGSLALEREENAFTRITRGSVGQTGLLVEKLLLGVVASIAVTFVMLGVLTPFVSIAWDRIGLIALAIAFGGAAFAAFGAAIGSAAREVRASSLLAFMISLPVAFLSLVPSGTVSGSVYKALEIFRALFPFDPSLDAMTSALDSSAPSIGVPLLHLAAITVAYAVLARLALRRFA
ncbi:MAG: type transport system permease protein [Solirubrobacterales bacterium]|jgi:ABC-2 type transport system permease protein|nr:type transport system permease protein [Solirubrobacterales bacterium]